MKLIALLPVKNEEWILPAYLSTVVPVVDEIVALDDGSSDASVHLLREAGAHVRASGAVAKSGWPENSIRSSLLTIGRERGGTHFLCLDADEALTCPAVKCIRSEIAELAPGQKLAMQWLALWKDPFVYRDDSSVWSNNFKDFAFADSPDLITNPRSEREFGVYRTHGANVAKDWRRMPVGSGAVLHFQFVPWQRFQAKQAWYRCAELIASPDGARRINRMYAPTLDDSNAVTTALPSEWHDGISIADRLNELGPAWQLAETLKLFDEHGSEYFEPVEIWQVPELRERFVADVGRQPTPVTTVSFATRAAKAWRNRFASRS